MIALGSRAIIAVGAVLLAAGGVVLGMLLSSDDDGDDTPEALVAFAEPPRVDVGDAPNYTLTALEQTITAGGERVVGRAYNGRYVGPTLVMDPGDTLGVTLQNDLGETTNVHYHGFHVTPNAPSDQVIHTEIAPGASYQYEVPIPSDHDEGTFWYHSHDHSMDPGTPGDSEGQVFGGMSGVAIIGDYPNPLVRGVPWLTERLLALKDFQVVDGRIPSENIDSNATTTRTVNGLVNPQMSGQPGAIELWRIANIGADIFYDVQLDGHQLWVVGEDGNPPARIWAADNLVLPPGKRYDVVVQFGGAGTYALETLAYDTGRDGDQYPRETLATLTLSGDAAETEPIPEDLRLSSAKVPKADAEVTKVLTEDDKGFYINDQKFDPGRVDDHVPLGSVQDWTFVNKTGEQHPIHIHQDDFWVVAENGQPVTPTGQQDTEIVPPGESRTMRIPFEDFTGQFVYHCHILAHEDNGMMAVVEVDD